MLAPYLEKMIFKLLNVLSVMFSCILKIQFVRYSQDTTNI